MATNHVSSSAVSVKCSVFSNDPKSVAHCWPTEEVPSGIKSWPINGYTWTGQGWTPAIVKATDDSSMSVDVGETVTDEGYRIILNDGETPIVLFKDDDGQWHKAREYSEVETQSLDADNLNTDIVTVDVRRDGEAGIGFTNRASSLTGLNRMLLEEAHLTSDNKPCLPHIDRSKPLWFKSAAQIKRRYTISQAQANLLAESFRILDTTPKMAVTFDRWIKSKGIDAAIRYFEGLAVQMVLVTDEGDPILDLMQPETPVEDNDDFDTTVELASFIERMPSDVQRDHLLDDPKDDEPRWEDRQSEAYRQHLSAIRGAADVQKLGAYMRNCYYGTKPMFTGVHATVAWDEFHRRKAALTPKLRKATVHALTRIADPKVDLAKVANWLYQQKGKLPANDISTLWTAWKQAKASRAPKQTAMNL